MILDLKTALVTYFLIGLFIAGFCEEFDDDPGTFVLVTALWPVLLVSIAFIFIVAIPIMFGKWMGHVVKRWF